MTRLFFARSPADLSASVFVTQEQGITQWFVRGITKNIGGLDYVSAHGRLYYPGRTLTLQQVTRGARPGRPDVVRVLATRRISNLKAGDSITLSTVLTQQPAAGTRFQLVISPGDLQSDNDKAERIYPR